MSIRVLGLCMVGNWEICDIWYIESNKVNENVWYFLSWVIGKCVILARWRVEKSIKVFGLCHVGKSVDTPRLKNVVFVICDPGVISLI